MSVDPSEAKTIVTADPGQVDDPRFRITQRLGSGGMGDVYLAEDSTLHRLVAIKAVRSDLCKDPEIRKRIERECLLHARVGAHPHIVTLFDKLERGDAISLVMEYVPGTTLQQAHRACLDKGTKFSDRDALEIAAQCLDALSRIHAQGIVHRDIKPDNLLLVRDESGVVCVKLMDFGIARLQDPDAQTTNLTSSTGAGPGTPLYMAPEQIDPRTFGAVSAATDIYAVGVMLYQLLTGTPPFTGSLTEVFRGHVALTPSGLDTRGDSCVPAPFLPILRRAMAKQPSDRFPSAKAFREELLSLAHRLWDPNATPWPAPPGPSPSGVRHAVAPEPPAKAPEHKRSLWRIIEITVLALLVVAAAAIGAWFVLQSGVLKPSPLPLLESEPSVSASPSIEAPAAPPVPIPEADTGSTAAPQPGPPQEPSASVPAPVPAPKPAEPAPKPAVVKHEEHKPVPAPKPEPVEASVPPEESKPAPAPKPEQESAPVVVPAPKPPEPAVDWKDLITPGTTTSQKK